MPTRAESRHDDVRRSGRFVAGDPLRAAAAFSVLAYHAALMGDRDLDDVRFQALYGSGPGNLLLQASSGLFIFFALSGYLISRPFIRSYVEGAPPPELRRYARHRLLRIVPAFWVVFTVTLLVNDPLRRPLGDVLVVYGFAQSLHETDTSSLIVQGWTLGVEMSFYLLVPLAGFVLLRLFGRVPRGVSRRLFVAGLSLAGAVAATHVEQDGPFYRTIVVFFWGFVPGILLAVAEPPPKWTPNASIRRGAYPASWLLLALGLWLLWHAPESLGEIAIGCGLVVAAPLLLQRLTGQVWPMVTWGWVQWLGERSYGIYLVHWGVLSLLRTLLYPGDARTLFVLFLLLGIPATVGLAALSYRFVEQPFLRLRRRTA